MRYIKIFKTLNDYNTFVNLNSLPSNMTAIISDTKEIIFKTNNIDGTDKTFYSYGEDYVFTVKYVDWDGTEIVSNAYHIGDEISTPEFTGNRDGFLFTGWDQENISQLKTSATIHAVYMLEPKIEIQVDDNYNDESSIAINYEKSATVNDDVTFSINLDEETAEIVDNVVVFKKHYNGELVITGTATDVKGNPVTASKTVSIICEVADTVSCEAAQSGDAVSVGATATSASIEYTCTVTTTKHDGTQTVSTAIKHQTVNFDSNITESPVTRTGSFQCEHGKTVNWTLTQAAGVAWKGLKFTAEENGSTVKLKLNGSTSTKVIQYSLDEGASWETYTTNLVITLANVGDTICWKSPDQVGMGTSWSQFKIFVMTGKIAASGNIMSLLNNITTIPCSFCFIWLFADCPSLTSAPELPATSLKTLCYQGLFKGCTNLVSAPDLPATVLLQECYNVMFNGCAKLVKAPKMTVNSLGKTSCQSLFNGCTSLTDISGILLNATIINETSYAEMFNSCTSLVSAPDLTAVTKITGARGMIKMFGGCTSLVEAPELTATTLATDCYKELFMGCTSLNYVKVAFSDFGTNNAYTTNWLSGVADLGTFVGDNLTDVNSIERGASTIPEGWTVLDGNGNRLDVNTGSEDDNTGGRRSLYEFYLANVSSIGVNNNDLANLKADTDNWEYRNNRSFRNINAIDWGSNLTANGTDLDITNGLMFEAPAQTVEIGKGMGDNYLPGLKLGNSTNERAYLFIEVEPGLTINIYAASTSATLGSYLCVAFDYLSDSNVIEATKIPSNFNLTAATKITYTVPDYINQMSIYNQDAPVVIYAIYIDDGDDDF